MLTLVQILENIKQDVNSGTVAELLKAERPMSYVSMGPELLWEEFAGLTDAVIYTMRDNFFEHLERYLSRLCKLRLEQGVRLSDIMAVFDLYEKSLKDVMSNYLHNDLIQLNRNRREIDALLDRARVYVSECFFQLYEDTVFRQFEHLRIINEISAHLTSSLKLDDVLKFIMTNAMKLFNADCGSICLAGDKGSFVTVILYGWKDPKFAHLIAQNALHMPEIAIIMPEDLQHAHLRDLIADEGLLRLIVIKLVIHDTTLGLLTLGLRSAAKFTATDKRVLVTFANHCAIAVNNAQLYGKTDRQLQERIHEATVLLEQKRAILDSMREGVVAIDADGVITFINNEALRLLNGAVEVVGEHIENIIPASRLPIVVRTGMAEYDKEQQIGNKVFITNRVPVVVNGVVAGAIATFRDKQDVKHLAEELVGVKALLDSMRAQSHEFINKLHAIAGLIQMGQYEKVVELINRISNTKQELVSFVVKRIKDTATAGLLLGKISTAQEKGVALKISSRSRLNFLPKHFDSLSMLTVLGNLITNAIEAVHDLPPERRVIEVRIFQGDKNLSIVVSDCGHGIPEPILDKIFHEGFSTKKENRGIGLALVRQEVILSGGKLKVYSRENEGSRFEIKIPVVHGQRAMKGG